MGVIINSVGDANTISFFENRLCQSNVICTKITSVLDYGKTDDLCLKQINSANIFILSHYHADHYNGLFRLKDKSLSISEVYVPSIPESDSYEASDVKKYIILAYVLGSVSGHPVLDLYNLMNQKSSQPFSIQEKKMGDSININQQKYHVIWPPQKANNVFSEIINKKIKAINEKISENSKVSEIWKQIKKTICIRKVIRIRK